MKTLTQLLENALYTVAVGFSPRLLRQINPNAEELLSNWDWLEQNVREII